MLSRCRRCCGFSCFCFRFSCRSRCIIFAYFRCILGAFVAVADAPTLLVASVSALVADPGCIIFAYFQLHLEDTLAFLLQMLCGRLSRFCLHLLADLLCIVFTYLCVHLEMLSAAVADAAALVASVSALVADPGCIIFAYFRCILGGFLLLSQIGSFSCLCFRFWLLILSHYLRLLSLHLEIL